MDKQEQSEIKRRYKEEVHAKGVYCVRCPSADSIWVDSSRNLLSSENRFAFSIKNGLNLNSELQQTVKAFGPDSFEFEVLEIFDQDLSSYELKKQLKERRLYWQASLSAQSLYR
jgi:hypothetical protein